jgi:hypothetical protein
MKTIENIKGVKAIQALICKKVSEIKFADLKQLGFDTSINKHVIGNIKLERDSLFNTYHLSIVDQNQDLDGNPICENSKLMRKILLHWEDGRREIEFSELIDLNIFTPATEIKIGNILLSNYFGIDSTYDITLIDKEKNIDNKWIDSAVTMRRVIDVLMKFPMDYSKLQLSELSLNKELENFFKKYFVSIKKSDPSNKGLIDLTIGNDKTKIAIELKLARKIKLAAESQKCRGQIEDYKKQFGSNLILVITGEREDRQEKYLQECVKKSESIGIKSVFLEAIK